MIVVTKFKYENNKIKVRESLVKGGQQLAIRMCMDYSYFLLISAIRAAQT